VEVALVGCTVLHVHARHNGGVKRVRLVRTFSGSLTGFCLTAISIGRIVFPLTQLFQLYFAYRVPLFGRL
jgi:hypothetical protein